MNNVQNAVPLWRYFFLPAGFAVAAFFLASAFIHSPAILIVILAYALTCAGVDWHAPYRHRWIARANFAVSVFFALTVLYGVFVVADTLIWRNRGGGVAGTIMQGGIAGFRDVCPGADQLEWRYLDTSKSTVAYRCWSGNSAFQAWPFYQSGESRELAVRIFNLLGSKTFPPKDGVNCEAFTSSSTAVGLHPECIVAIKNGSVDVPGVGLVRCNEEMLRGSEMGVGVPRACIEQGSTLIRETAGKEN